MLLKESSRPSGRQSRPKNDLKEYQKNTSNVVLPQIQGKETKEGGGPWKIDRRIHSKRFLKKSQRILSLRKQNKTKTNSHNKEYQPKASEIFPMNPEWGVEWEPDEDQSLEWINCGLVGVLQVSQLRQETNCLQKEMENRHKVVTNRDYVPLLKSEMADGTRMQGYLFKKNTSAFKTWNRRWFAIRSSQLVYRKRGELPHFELDLTRIHITESGCVGISFFLSFFSFSILFNQVSNWPTGDQEETVMEQDLKLCSVKPLTDIDRRYCFEVISPTK